ncbi:MAG: hypothetical protein IPL52_10275 [Flavobacteriales bacterium]|nr:hypothetical protein [Flavobacteriales bacterium]
MGCLLIMACAAQIHDMRWLGGYLGSAGDPEFGGNKTLFQPPGPTWSVIDEHNLNFDTSVGVYTDEEDSIIAYTEAWNVANKAYQVMPNGAGLNPTSYIDSDLGFNAHATHFFLPWPDRPDSIALFHMIWDTIAPSGAWCSARLYLSTIDRTLDNGHGDVVSMNQVLVEELMPIGGLSAVRHANGRDWWVLTHGLGNNDFISLLLTPYGVHGPFYQSIGSISTGSNPPAAFSMQGDRLATAPFAQGLDLFDFDRCTGVLSNWQHAFIATSPTVPGVQFSPNGSYLYVTHVSKLYQYPIQSGVLGVPDTVAVWDGFYDEFPQFATPFSRISLASDGKMYISTGNSTRYLHVMHDPDATGVACNVVQHEHYRQTWTANSIPYRPNFSLGPIDGTVCDSLGITVGITEASLQADLRAQPNPSNGEFLLRYAGLSEPGRLLDPRPSRPLAGG